MTALELFDYSGQQVRSLLIDGEPWFVASDVAQILGYSATGAMTRSLDEDEKGVQDLHTPGGDQALATISEAGLFSAIMRSQLAEAKAFKRWVTHDVLPAIRKTGSYSVQPELTREQRLAFAMLDSAEIIKELDAKVAELQPAASAWQHMVAADGDYAVADAAKTLSRGPQVSIGRDRLFAYMADLGWIYRWGPRRAWKAYQEQVDNGRLVEKLARPFLNERTGEYELPAPTIRVTTKGLAELQKRLTAPLALVSTG